MSIPTGHNGCEASHRKNCASRLRSEHNEKKVHRGTFEVEYTQKYTLGETNSVLKSVTDESVLALGFIVASGFCDPVLWQLLFELSDMLKLYLHYVFKRENRVFVAYKVLFLNYYIFISEKMMITS